MLFALVKLLSNELVVKAVVVVVAIDEDKGDADDKIIA